MTRITASVAGALLLVAACPSSGKDAPARAADGPVLVAAPAEGDVAAYVAAEMKKAEADGYRTLVYVGATWCEPCKHFKRAVASGELRKELGDVRLLEFDSDRDDPRLTQAGYGSSMIPLFVVPGPDGRGTDARVAGGSKGPEGVARLVPHIVGILGDG